MNENIYLNEERNDGRTIHLYFKGLIGLYAAYGQSAYILSKQTKVSPSYSDEMQMPVVVINLAHYELLKERLEVAREGKNYRCLKVEEAVNPQEYEEWTQGLKG